MLSEEEKTIIRENLKRIGADKLIDENQVFKMVEVVKETLPPSPFGNRQEIPAEEISPFWRFNEMRRLTRAPCRQRLRWRKSLAAMKYYYEKHIERHNCREEPTAWIIPEIVTT